MKPTLTILGSGTMVPTKERNPAAFLLKVGGIRILLDCGHGTLQRMVQYGIDPQSIDVLFISHFHTDHFGGVMGLIHSRFVEDIYLKRKNKKLMMIGPKNLEKNFETLRKISWPEPHENYPLVFKEGSQKIRIGKIKIEIFRVRHVEWFQSVGIRITLGKKTVVYTGDIGSTHPFADLVKQTKNADLLITEASHEYLTESHYSFGQIEELVEKANIKKALIVHIPFTFVKRLKQLVGKKPKFVVGKDGIKLPI